MATVAGVFLDHVHEHFAYGNLLFFVGERDQCPEVLEAIDAPLSEGNFLMPCIPRIGNDGRIRVCAIEVSVTVFARTVPPRSVLTREDLAVPVPLDIGHVADEAHERHVRRRNRSPGHLLEIKTLALEFQGLAASGEEVDQRRPLAD